MLTHPKGLGTQFLDTQSNGSVSDGKFFSFHSYGIALKKLTQGDELHNVVNSLLRRATLIRAYPLSLSLSSLDDLAAAARYYDFLKNGPIPASFLFIFVYSP